MRAAAISLCSVLLAAFCMSASLRADSPVTPAPDQLALLQSADPRLAANKRLVFDLYRIVFAAGRHDLADRYLAENYIQHNPNIPNGRAAAIARMPTRKPDEPVLQTIALPIVSIVAEGDLVVVASVRRHLIPGKPEETYTTTWFDMFRIANDRIVEHWDGRALE